MSCPSMSCPSIKMPISRQSLTYLTPFPSKTPLIKVPLCMHKFWSSASPIEVFLSYSTIPSKFLKPKKSGLLWKQITFLSFSHSSFLKISAGLSLLASSSTNIPFIALEIILSLVIVTPYILFAKAFQLIAPAQKSQAVGSRQDISSSTKPKVNIAADSKASKDFVPKQCWSLGLQQILPFPWYFLPKFEMKKLQPQCPQILHKILSGERSRYSLAPLALRNKKSAICQKKAVISSAQNFYP